MVTFEISIKGIAASNRRLKRIAKNSEKFAKDFHVQLSKKVKQYAKANVQARSKYHGKVPGQLVRGIRRQNSKNQSFVSSEARHSVAVEEGRKGYVTTKSHPIWKGGAVSNVVPAGTQIAPSRPMHFMRDAIRKARRKDIPRLTKEFEAKLKK
jgi:hypothetical protein